MISVAISCDDSILSRRAFSTFRILPRSGRIAWYCESRPCLAEPPARITLDDEQLGLRRIALPTVGELARQRRRIERALALHHVARLARRLARARRQHALAMICLASFGCSSSQVASRSFTTAPTMPVTSDETSLSFGWFENFGSGCLTLTIAVSPSTRSAPDRPCLRSLSRFARRRVGVDRARERLRGSR